MPKRSHGLGQSGQGIVSGSGVAAKPDCERGTSTEGEASIPDRHMAWPLQADFFEVKELRTARFRYRDD